MAKSVAPARGFILDVTLVPAIRSAARKPLAFTIQDITNSLPAGGAAVACQDARRAHGVFVAARPFAQRKAEKKFCCVTTRRRKFWALSDLRRGLGPLAARSLCQGVLGFSVGVGVLATFSLPLRRQPAADLPQAFRILAVSLVPTPRLVLAFAPFVQAGPRAGAALSGLGTVLSFNVVVAHGRFDLPRERPGENVTAFSPGAIKTRTK
jgi:hypothetical protein